MMTLYDNILTETAKKSFIARVSAQIFKCDERGKISYSTWKWIRISFQKGYYLKIKIVKDIEIIILNNFTDTKKD